MADYVETRIFEGLVEHLIALGLSEPIAYPNIGFEPPTTGGYLRPSLLPAETLQVTLGTEGQNRHTGLFQVSVFWPEGQGESKPSEIAGEIIAHFKRGTLITRETQKIKIIKPPYRNPAIQEPAWFSIPVRISFQADADNPA